MERKYLFYHTGLGLVAGVISFLVIIFIVVNLVFTLTEHPILQLLVIAGGSGAVILSSFYADKWSQQNKWKKNLPKR